MIVEKKRAPKRLYCPVVSVTLVWMDHRLRPLSLRWRRRDWSTCVWVVMIVPMEKSSMFLLIAAMETRRPTTRKKLSGLQCMLASQKRADTSLWPAQAPDWSSPNQFPPFIASKGHSLGPHGYRKSFDTVNSCLILKPLKSFLQFLHPLHFI